jgi:hypothetical protein
VFTVNVFPPPPNRYVPSAPTPNVAAAYVPPPVDPKNRRVPTKFNAVVYPNTSIPTTPSAAAFVDANVTPAGIAPL